MDFVAKRASLRSIEITRKSLGIDDIINSKPEPKDAFYLCRILFFFIGFMELMPVLFLGSAANYWFFKFRNATLETYNAEDRTELQSLYQSCSMVAQSLPSLAFISLMTIYGHKINPKSMTVATLVSLIAIFSTFGIFTQVDTDNWQTGFFIATMFLLVLNSAAVACFQLASIVIVARFPNSYMIPFLLGQGGTIISDFLQVISISITDDQPTAAAIYFAAGVLLIAINLGLLFAATFTEPYKMYMQQSKEAEGTGAQKISWDESKKVMRDIWPSLVLLVLLILTISCIHPSTDTLVVSEFEGDKTVWTTKYFVPVITFLLADAAGIGGRLFSSYFKITKSNQIYWIIGGVMRFVGCVLFVMFCNAQPRHLPVLFNHDWEYIIFVIVFSSSNGLLFNVAFQSLEGLSGNTSSAEVSLKICSVIIAVGSSVFSANGILMVKLL